MDKYYVLDDDQSLPDCRFLKPGEFKATKKELEFCPAIISYGFKKVKPVVIHNLEECLLEDEEIKNQLEVNAPEGFNWGDITDTELNKYKIVAKAQHEKDMAYIAQCVADERERIIKWGEEPCPHRDNDFPDTDNVPPYLQLSKRECIDCWNELKQGKGGG